MPPEGAENWDIVLSGDPLYFIHTIRCNVEMLFLLDPFFGLGNEMNAPLGGNVRRVTVLMLRRNFGPGRSRG